MIGKPFGPEASPVIGSDLVQRVDDIVKGVSLYFRGFTRPSMKNVAKVIHGLLAIGLLSDDRIGPEPVQFIFLVVIERTTPGIPFMRRVLHGWNSISRI